MNKFVLEPTDENLERHKRVKGTNTYWHTADFFQYDHSFKDELDLILDAYIDAIRESEETVLIYDYGTCLSIMQ